MTQAGFIRLSSNPKVVKEDKTPGHVLAVLKELISDAFHSFITVGVNLAETEIPAPFLLGHRQVTDCYLTALAFQENKIFVTLDRGLKQIALNTAWDNYVMVPS